MSVSSAPTAYARLVGRLAVVFLDPEKALPGDRRGLAPLSPEALAAAPAPARRAVSAALVRDCGLAEVDIPERHLRRLRTSEEARFATFLATLPPGDLIAAARLLAIEVFADLGKRLVLKRDRERFAAALGPQAIAPAQRRGRVQEALTALAPPDAGVALADRPTLPVGDPESAWRRPVTTALVAAEPPMVRLGLVVLASWIASVEDALVRVLAARLGELGPLPPLDDRQREAIMTLLSQRMDAWRSFSV